MKISLPLLIACPAVLAQSVSLTVDYSGSQCDGTPIGATSIDLGGDACTSRGCTIRGPQSADDNCVKGSPEAAVNKALLEKSRDPFWTVVAYGNDACNAVAEVPTALAMFPSQKCYVSTFSMQSSESEIKVCNSDDCSGECVTISSGECVKSNSGWYWKAQYGAPSTKSDASSYSVSPLTLIAVVILAMRIL